MLKLSTLWEGKFVSVVSPVEFPYESLHEKDIVIVIPVLMDTHKIGVRRELCPPYLIKEHDFKEDRKYWTLITGKVDVDDNSLESLWAESLRELKEESGIDVNKARWITVAHNLPFCKSTDMRATISVVLIEEYKIGVATTDGTEYEKRSETVWLTMKEYTELVGRKYTDYLFLFGNYILREVFESER